MFVPLFFFKYKTEVTHHAWKSLDFQWKEIWLKIFNLIQAKDSFITQDRNDDFEGGQVESTFSGGHCDLTSGAILNK